MFSWKGICKDNIFVLVSVKTLYISSIFPTKPECLQNNPFSLVYMIIEKLKFLPSFRYNSKKRNLKGQFTHQTYGLNR